MDEFQLSEAAKREQAALQATNERMHLESIQMESKIKALEEIARRKQDIIRRQEEFLTQIEAERAAIEADYQRVCAMEFVN